MNAEKYVRQITRKIMCSTSRKKDIEKQLLTEIAERIQRGEQLAEIISEMGSIEEIADNFNEAISKEEKRNYKTKKLVKIILPVMFLVFVTVCLLKWYLPKTSAIEDSMIFARTEIENQLIKTIDLLDLDDYDALQNISSSKMKTLLSGDTIKRAKNSVSEDWGKRISLGSIYVVEMTQMNHHYAVCQVNTAYENVSVAYTITFVTEMKIAGLYMK